MSRLRTSRFLLPLSLVAVLGLAACSSSEPAGDGASPTTTASPGAGAETGTEGGTAAPEGETFSADLADGVAATVGDTEIPTEDLEARLELTLESDQMKQQLEQGDPEQVRQNLQGQILQQMVLQKLIVQAAAAEGVEVTQEDIAKERASLAEQFGGEDALQEQLQSVGLPKDQLEGEIRASVAIQQVTEGLMADTEPSDNPTAQQQAEAQAQQQWLLGKVSEIEVVVDEEYGAWDPAQVAVVPA